MRSGSVIAGSLGLTLVAGGLLLLGAIGALSLVLLAPVADPEAVRAALVDASEDLELCAAGTPGGSLELTLVLHRGQARHVGIADATVSSEVAHCIADSLVTRPWPGGASGAVRVPIVLER